MNRSLLVSLLAVGSIPAVTLVTLSVPAAALTPPAKPGSAAPEAPAPGSWEARLATIKEWRDARRAEGKPIDRAALTEVVRGAMEGVDFSSLSFEQLQSGWSSLAVDPGPRDAALARLKSLAQAASADGAASACFLAMVGTDDQAATAALAKAALDHPSLEAHLERAGLQARAQTAGLLQSLEKGDQSARAAKVLAWAEHFGPATPPRDFRSSVGYLTALREMKEVIGPENLEKARTRILASAQAAAAAARDGERPDDAAALERLIKRLDSPAMRGMLLDHPAPALTMNWTHDVNGTPTWKSLEDLKGKVVVLDFWATWCGPCVASFPAVRELRAHYSPEDVVIIGVTSLQGAHYWRPNEAKPDRPSKVETKDDPKLEESLMTEYMQEMEITWPVVFTAQDVFNTDYDVSGIPHVAIIDADGVLRFNNLHPASPLSEKTAKIDQLLLKAGKTPPPAPAAPPAPADSADPAKR